MTHLPSRKPFLWPNLVTVKLVPPSTTWFLPLISSLVALFLLIFGLCLLTFLSNVSPQECNRMPACPGAPSSRHGHILNTEYAAFQGQHKTDRPLQNLFPVKTPLLFCSVLPLANRKHLWAWEWAGLYPLAARRSCRRSDLHPFILVRLLGPRFFRGEMR